MLMIANILAGVVDAAVVLPISVVSTEIALAVLRRSRLSSNKEEATTPRPTVGIVVPAHNEHENIARTVRALAAQLQHGDRLIVVADNCSDDTAALARDAGAEVIERTNTVDRGKGFALDYGVRHLESTGPTQVGMIVDADVVPGQGAIDALARQALQTNRPAQAVYLLKDQGINPISTLAFRVRNLVRPLGLWRIGGPCPLFGAGMAFPWDIIAKAPLASPHLTEDVALALDLACTGRPPKLCPAALIEGESAPSAASTMKQRTRWEHGHLSLIFSHVPRTLVRGVARGSIPAIVLALDVMVPPLSLLVMLSVAVSALMLLLALVKLIAPIFAIVPIGMTLVLALMLLAAAERFAPGVAGPAAMARYAIGKMSIYTGFLFKRQKSWQRTDRVA